MIIVNTPQIDGEKIVETLGVVRGNTVRARNVGRDIVAGFKGLVGGEIEEYTKLISQAREIAMNKMIEDAKKLGADAVLNVRFTTSQIANNMAEILAYGTAVKLKK